VAYRSETHRLIRSAATPRGNKNAKTHGLYTREAILERREFNELVRQSRKLILKVK